MKRKLDIFFKQQQKRKYARNSEQEIVKEIYFKGKKKQIEIAKEN